ncbi:DUF6502 family protein [Rhodobacter sp. Har01]|uniref:DUF6502 family protein n=1 Tax=Rhodobacter sp. Har01 TaxID=2883999 RepID=UPI001D085B61|nr:DUF6502 family protein [Rhodobacter sp. Har01]MCB6177753.1 DUF6502 family protein [Rhodobacter sp. Har01]
MMDLFDALFAPVARLLVARGVLFPALAERMKAHYVQAALAQSEGRATDSRVSVLTGLQRRDVARLRGADVKDQRPGHLSRLVALWQTDPAWATDPPLTLPRGGPAPSFEALALAVRRDVHARTMLDALVAAGTVALSADGQTVRLAQPSYQPLAGSDDQLAYLARNLGDHAQAAFENVQGREPPHFERAVHYTGLTDVQVAALAARFTAAEMALFAEISQTAAQMKRSNQPPGRMRFRAGGYFFRTGDD